MGQDPWIISSWVVALLFVIFVSVLWSYVPRWKRSLSYKRLPPGPNCWPIVGYLPMLHPSKGYLKLQKLSEKYGSVFSLYVGHRYVVILNNFESMKEAYSKDEFLGRPVGAAQIHEDQSSILQVDGAEWREMRRFIFNSFRLLGVGTPEFENFILSQVSDVNKYLRDQQDSGSVNVQHAVEGSLNNIIFHMIFRKIFDKDHPVIKFLSSFDTAVKVTLATSAVWTFFPWLGNLMRFVMRGTRKTMDKMDELVLKEINEHRQTLNPNEPRDFIDLFLLQMEKLGPNPFYNPSTLLGNIKLIFVGASDTPRMAVVWFLMLMAAYPEIQDKVHKEIDDTLGREREPRYADRIKLPYTEAAICESMRFRNAIHLNIFRRATSDTILCGFDIPKDTIIIHNMTSHFHDPNLWERPQEFDPTRFLSKDRSKVIAPEFFIPLSYGKRNCVGEKVATIQNFLFPVAIVQKFQVLPPDGGINLDIKTVFSNEQAQPYLRFKLRE